MDFRFYEMIALSDKMNKFILFHMHEVQTLAQLKYYCSLLFTCSKRSLGDMKAVSEIWTQELFPIINSKGTKIKVVIQDGERGAIVLWRLGLDAPQTVSREIIDPLRLHQVWMETLFWLANKAPRETA